ncbi:hypothetical protein LTR17_007560 [Elasticomyces elasticus]|nr:hypothetical protein LTR17_007560 [Elasticomyces elasticus]
MGASNSTVKGTGSATEGKRSPVQEKHTSGDSTAPFALKAAELGIVRSPTIDKHASFSEKSVGRSRTNTLSFHGSSYTADDIESIPTTIHELDGHSNVSRPPRPPRLRHLSELIDPAELPIDAHVRSPSGHLLAPEEYLVHPDRPLSIRERQAEIRERVRAASRLGVETEDVEEKPATPVKKERVSWCCFC